MDTGFRTASLLALAGLAGVTALAWQGGLAALGVNEAQAKKVVQERLLASVGEEAGLPNLTYAPVRNAFLKLTPEQRTSAAQALAAVVKPLLLSAEFRAAWEGEVARRGGVNHGLVRTKPAPVLTEQDLRNQTSDLKKTILKQQLTVAERFAKDKQALPADTLKMLIDLDRQMLGEKDSMMVASPGAQKAALAKLDEAKKLADANPAAARKALSDAKFLALGVTPDGAGLAAAQEQIAQNKAQEEKERQQDTWNRTQMVPQLKRQLQEFITLAGSVDFAAATVAKGDKKVFVNPAYERKSEPWKMLYRAGRGPVTVAAAAAKQVLAELR